VGGEAYVDAQDMLDHDHERVAIGLYKDTKQRLKAGKAAKKEEASAEWRA
jgi:hypothetical protein